MASEPVFADVKPMPAQPKPAEAGIGHNRPPAEDDVRAQFLEKLLDGERANFLTRLREIEQAAERVEVKDDETLGRAGDMMRIVRAAEKHVSDTHTVVKAPYLAASRICDAEKNALVGRLSAVRGKVEGRMNAYAAEKRRQDLEEQRIADGERRKLEELARANDLDNALPPPVAAPVRQEPIRSDAGATVSTTVEHVAVVEDYGKAFRKVKDDAGVREAIDKAVQRIVKQTKGATAIPGVRIVERAKALAR